jgi:hypothetical protein
LLDNFKLNSGITIVAQVAWLVARSLRITSPEWNFLFMSGFSGVFKKKQYVNHVWNRKFHDYWEFLLRNAQFRKIHEWSQVRVPIIDSSLHVGDDSDHFISRGNYKPNSVELSLSEK